MQNPSVFTKIINREIPANIVYENENTIAFLDIRPLTKGHTLVVPKIQIDYLFDLPDEIYINLMNDCKILSHALKKITNCQKVCMVVLGFEVPHAHIHLIPSNSEADVNFSKHLNLDKEEMAQIQQKIIDALKNN